MRGAITFGLVSWIGVALVLPGAMAASDVDVARRHVETLASDEMEGRLTGEKGARMAADYLIGELEALGVRPLPGAKTLRHAFDFTAGSRDVGTSLKLTNESGEQMSFGGDTNVVHALSFSAEQTVDGEVVFVGYGLKLPEGSDFPYNSYAGLDVEGKIVLALRYFPEDVDKDTRAQLARYSGLRYKALMAREAGAKAMIVVAGPNSPHAGETVPMQFDTSLSGSGIAALSIDDETAAALLREAGAKPLAELQTALDTGNPHVTGFELEGVRASLDVRIERERREGANVIGYLPPTAGNASDAIALGAHYDHLGRGEGGNSLAGADQKGEIHNGADDNASGVSAVLRVAAQLADVERSRPLVFGFWGGEEIGLLGASAFVDELEDLPLTIGTYLNFDMVGRLADDKLTLQAMGSSEAWPGLVEQANVVAGFDLQTTTDPYLPTDSQAFYLSEISTLNFFTGSHEDYHRPSDDADKINFEGIEQIADFAVLITKRLLKGSELPAYAQVERAAQGGAGRASMRAFTGTIPDYTTEVEGLLLSGVVGGGPAEESGMRKGDIIVEFDGQSIRNIYDYTYALEAAKIGETIVVIVNRDGERIEMKLTPRAR